MELLRIIPQVENTTATILMSHPLPLVQDLQVQMDEDARQHEELREKYSLQERRLCLMQGEMEELRGGLEASERARKQIEQELVDTTERFSEISMQVNGCAGRLQRHTHIQTTDGFNCFRIQSSYIFN